MMPQLPTAEKLKQIYHNAIAYSYGIGILGLIYFGLFIIHDHFWGEQEGIIKTVDCRETIIVKRNSPGVYFNKFTCQYIRSNKGYILGGTCASVITQGSVCKTAYTYTFENEKYQHLCVAPAPYYGTDDMCHGEKQF